MGYRRSHQDLSSFTQSASTCFPMEAGRALKDQHVLSAKSYIHLSLKISDHSALLYHLQRGKCNLTIQKILLWIHDGINFTVKSEVPSI